MLEISIIAFILAIWFRYAGYWELKHKDDWENQKYIITDNTIIGLWDHLSAITEKRIDWYSNLVPFIYGCFSAVFFIFHLKDWGKSVPDFYFLDHPILISSVTLYLFVVTVVSGGTAVLTDKPHPYFKKQKVESAVTCLDPHAFKKNLLILSQRLNGSCDKNSEDYASDLKFLKVNLFYARHLGKIAVLWHVNLSLVFLSVILIVLKFN